MKKVNAGKKYDTLEIFCWIISFASMLLFLFLSEIPELAFTKAFAILWLIVLALNNEKNGVESRQRNIIIGLAFGVSGDVLLIAPEGIHFLSGAICFFVGHIFYITAFFEKKKVNLKSLFFLTILGLIALALLIDYTIINKDYMLFSIASSYELIILVMAYFALNTKIPYIQWSAAMFVVSDFLIFLTLVSTLPDITGDIIWITYYGAQSLFNLSIKMNRN